MWIKVPFAVLSPSSLHWWGKAVFACSSPHSNPREGEWGVEKEGIWSAVQQAASPNLSESLQSQQPDIPTDCCDVFQWPNSWLHRHPCYVLSQPSSLLKQQYLAVIQQPRYVYLCIASCSASVVIITSMGHLPPSMSRCSEGTGQLSQSAISKPTEWSSLLQTDSILIRLSGLPCRNPHSSLPPIRFSCNVTGPISGQDMSLLIIQQ